MRTMGRGFDCIQTSATQHHTKACRAGVQLHSDSYQSYSDGFVCTKQTAQVTRHLLAVAWSPCISSNITQDCMSPA